LAHGERYGYIEEKGLTLKQIKPEYKKKELKKLEH